MKRFRIEVCGTWDVLAEDREEAREILRDALPQEGPEIEECDVVIRVIDEEDVDSED